MDRGAWQATVHGVTMSQTQLSDFHFQTFFQLICLDLSLLFVFSLSLCVLFLCFSLMPSFWLFEIFIIPF